MELSSLKCINDNIDVDKYIEFMNLVRTTMEYPEWLGDLKRDDIEYLMHNKSKIWMHYNMEDIVCSMMFIPTTKEDIENYDLNLDYNVVADYGPMMVNNKYIGNKLQYQMLQVLDKYSVDNGYQYAVATVHPDNIYSINNLVKDNFNLTGNKEFKRGKRNIYVKYL